MPTGGGKSICFQIPAMVMEGLCLVISPLIALMDDQVMSLKQLGIQAASLHSNMTHESKIQIDSLIRNNQLKLLYVSPEKMRSDKFIDFIRTKQVNLIAIDEAHCVSIWGNDFRPDYVELKSIKKSFPDTPVIALTATADSITQDDIISQLQLKSPKKFVSSFERKNISVLCRPGQERVKQIYQFISKHSNEAGIIYCLSRKGTENIAEKLVDRGIKAAHYHAGCDPAYRSKIQTQFHEGDIDIVCATIAFGMGIDKPNIRYVIHYNMPKNIEGYYQEIGRSGRDGEPAEALLFYNWADRTQLQKFIDESEAPNHFKMVQTSKLDRMWQYANSKTCRTNLVLNYFGEYKSDNCGHCDNCHSPPKLIDGATYAKMAISGVIRCGEKLNLQLLMDLLKGSGKAEVMEIGLHKIKTYGVGRDLPYSHWRFYINQMIDLGILLIDLRDGGKLKTTPLSADVIKGAMPVPLAAYINPSKIQNIAPITTSKTVEKYDESLFVILKKWRLQKARIAKVPPYVIFNDRTLKLISAHKPKDNNQLLLIDGLGKVKLERYGEELLKIIGD